MMSIQLEPPFRVGKFSVSVVVRQHVQSHEGPFHIAASGSKEPLAILVYDGEALCASHPDGRPIDMEDLNKICPNAAATMLEG